MSGSFYPHGKPSKYSYTLRFIDVGNDYEWESYFNTMYPGIENGYEGTVRAQVLTNLKAIIDAARAAELAFLADTGIDITNVNTAGEVFRNINNILNSKQTIERGIKYMKSLTKRDKKDQMYRDVTRYFTYYLQEAINEETLGGNNKVNLAQMNPSQFEDFINTIISNALIKSYTRVKDFVASDGNIRGKFGAHAGKATNEEEVQAITDMISAIESLKDKGIFGKYGYLFKLDMDFFKSLTRSGKGNVILKKAKFNDAKVDSNFGGNALELITSVVAAEIGNINIANSGLTITGMHTGQMNNMKADSLLFVGKGTIKPSNYIDYVEKDKWNNSVRSENVDALGKYLNDLEENVKHVIAISDKNYSITSDFGGITAQEKMNLKNVGQMLTQFGVGQVDELIDYLANCGPEMVQGDVNGEVRTALQAMIGYFLFDHLQIQGGVPNVNVVNLINVSGMYIPLSVYLEGLYNSLQEIAGHPAQLVSVSISLGGQTRQPVWTAETWEAFRNSHEEQSFIEYRILTGIANFISNL